jgi:hypothetical protein
MIILGPFIDAPSSVLLLLSSRSDPRALLGYVSHISAEWAQLDVSAIEQCWLSCITGSLLVRRSQKSSMI